MLLLGWMTLIFCLSAQGGDESSVTSNSFGALLYTLLRSIFPFLQISLDAFVEEYVPLIRKIAHFSEFAVLGILIYLNLWEFSKKNIIVYSSLLSVLYAALDEIHQLFVDGRCCSVKDVLIDSAGALCGILFCHFLKMKWRK